MTTKYLTITDIGSATIRATAISPFNLGLVEFVTIESLNPVQQPTGPRENIPVNPQGATGPRVPESDTQPPPPQRGPEPVSPQTAPTTAPPTSPTTASPRGTANTTPRNFR